jgi:hypothetical protein
LAADVSTARPDVETYRAVLPPLMTLRNHAILISFQCQRAPQPRSFQSIDATAAAIITLNRRRISSSTKKPANGFGGLS